MLKLTTDATNQKEVTMIVTNQALGSEQFNHHSVALANLEFFAIYEKPLLILAGLEADQVLAKANSAAFKGVLSSAEAEAILGKAAPYFFAGFRPLGKQWRLLHSSLNRASSTNTRVDR